MNFQERLERVRVNQNANCYGTAYFLSGASDELVDVPDKDWSMSSESAMAYWDRLEILSEPVVQCYMGIIGPMPRALNFLEGDFLYHLAIVVATDPIRIIHRNGNKGVVLDELLSEVIKREVNSIKLRPQFRAFSPHKLQ